MTRVLLEGSDSKKKLSILRKMNQYPSTFDRRYKVIDPKRSVGGSLNRMCSQESPKAISAPVGLN